MKNAVCIVLAFVLGVAGLQAQDETLLLRFPATNGTSLVFSFAGDLYSVPLAGGTARRLTSHTGYEVFPRFSPSGEQIAFTGQYDGNTEVFLIPASGGEPERVTYTATLGRDDVSDRMGPNNIVMTWKNTADDIVFRSRMKSYNSFNGQLYTVSVDGGMPDQIPVPRGGFISYSPDDSKIAYNRVFREFRTWKRYRGGMADDIWVLDLASKQLQNITNDPAQDIIPMWKGDRIYFLSDRDANKRMNLFVYEISTQTTRQLTEFDDFDIKFPSLGPNEIVFEKGGRLHRLDLQTEQHAAIPVSITNDHAAGRTSRETVSSLVNSYEIAPDGKRALFSARGDLFTVPATEGITRNLTSTPGAHDRNPKWSPDGKWIAYISDQSGEDEIWVRQGDGKGEPRQLTIDGDTYRYPLFWSPDSKMLLWGDKKQRLRIVEVDSGKTTQIVQAEAWEITQYSWSPDSKWVAYTKPETDGFSRIYLYSLQSAVSTPVTDGWFASGEPVFSPDGKFLFFWSNRDFNPTYSQTEWNHVYQDMSRIYLVTLADSTASPFRLKNDEVAVQSSTPAAAKPAAASAASSVALRVDLEGIGDRIDVLPIEPSQYGGFTATKGKLYYVRNGSGDDRPMLFVYDLEKKKETQVGPINGYEISADGKKMLVSQRANTYSVVDTPTGELKVDGSLDLSGMSVLVDKEAEWRQIFMESWRQMRDFFFVSNMHGVDWEAMRNQYAALLPYVKHRNDLTYLIGEMISELNVGHAYVSGGDRPVVARIPMGLLGAEFTKESESGFFRIDRILPGQSWDNSLRSPLTEPGVSARQGEYLVAIDGKSTATMDNFQSALVGKAEKMVQLKINDKPSLEGAREVLVKPIGDESGLYYLDWVEGNIRKVNEASDGAVGYVHIPDMGVPGLNQFARYYYPQLRKKALIVDVRGNGGGNVSPMIIERLRREAVMINIARNGSPNPDPGGMVMGPLVALADEFSASDGDIFTYRFKQMKLGKVVGKRTWGGVVGIRGSLPFVDGGQLNRPEFSRYDLEGKEWIMEGVGVEPDIFVDNDPSREFAGVDDQLNEALKVILEELKNTPPVPGPPPPPIKN